MPKHRPRVRLGLEASRATLDTARAAELGQQARAARTARSLDMAAIGKALMLSPAQIRALEEVTPEAFYGAEYYVNALRKYLAYLDLNAAAAADVLVAAATSPQAPAGHAAESVAPSRFVSLRSPAALAALAAGVMAVAGGAGWYALSQRAPTDAPGSSAAQIPTPTPGSATTPGSAAVPGPAATTSVAQVAASADAPQAPPASSPNSQVLEPAAATVQATHAAVESADTAVDHGGVTVGASTWVFVRYEDNATDERRIGAGETFVFRRHPIFIAVGQVDGTVIHVNGERIDAKPHIANGQIRIGRDVLGTPLAGG